MKRTIHSILRLVATALGALWCEVGAVRVSWRKRSPYARARRSRGHVIPSFEPFRGDVASRCASLTNSTPREKMLLAWVRYFTMSRKATFVLLQRAAKRMIP